MKSLLSLLAAVLLLLPATVSLYEAPPSTDVAAVEQAAMDYLAGTGRSDVERLRRAFDGPNARLQFVRDGEYQEIAFLDWAERIEANAGGAPADRQEIVASVDVAGDAAMAKVLLIYPDGTRITDFLAMLKVDGQWRIVNKTFARE